MVIRDLLGPAGGPDEELNQYEDHAFQRYLIGMLAPKGSEVVEHSGTGWVGYYRNTAGGRYRLARLQRNSVGEAQQTLGRFRGAHATAVASLGNEAFAVGNEANGELVVVRAGNDVWIVADGGAPGMPSLDRAAKIAVARAALAPPAPVAADR